MVNPANYAPKDEGKAPAFRVGDRVEVISIPAGSLLELLIHVGDAGMVSRVVPLPGIDRIFVMLDNGAEIPLTSPRQVRIVKEGNTRSFPPLKSSIPNNRVDRKNPRVNHKRPRKGDRA